MRSPGFISATLEAAAVVFRPLAAGVAPGVVVALIVGSPVLVVDVHRLPDVDPTGPAVVAIVGIAAVVVAVAGHVVSPV